MRSRRRFLQTMGAGVVVGIAGCNTERRDDPRTKTETTTTETTTTTTTEEETETTTTSRSNRLGWSTAAPLPAPQSDVGSGVIDGTLYVFGGIESDQGLAAVARTYAFDTTTEEWTREADLPRALWGNAGVATADALFSFGGAPADSPYETGEPPSDEIFVFRPGDGWEHLTETKDCRCPYRNFGMRGVYNPEDGLIYCVSGATDVSTRDTATNHGAPYGSVGAYDEYRVWTFDPERLRVVDDDFTRLPEAKRWSSIALVADDDGPAIYAIGGWRGNSGPTDSNVRIDPHTGEVTTMRRTPLPGIYSANTNPVIDGQVFLSHGLFTRGGYTMDSYRVFCHRYDPVNDEFHTDLPKASHIRVGAADGVVDGVLHVVGGHIKPFQGDKGHDAVTYHERFRPEPD
jgi:Kelch motif